MDKVVAVDVLVESGQLVIDGALFIGETVDITFSGVTGYPRLVIFSQDGKTALADNATTSTVLDLRGDSLRRSFGNCTGSKAFKAMLFGTDDDVFAQGMVVIRWSPVVFDEAHEPATMKGAKGDRGPQGDVGPMGPISQVKDPDTGLWYDVYARVDAEGNRVLSMSQSASDPNIGGNVAMKTTSVTFTRDSASGGETSKTLIRAVDSQGLDVSQFGTHKFSDGTVGTDIATFRKANGTTYSAVISLRVGTDGKGVIDLYGVDGIKGSAAAGAAMPTTADATAITLPESGTDITFSNGTIYAPANGWLVFSKYTSAGGQYVSLRTRERTGSTLALCKSYGFASGDEIAVTVPVAKGCRVTPDYTAGGTTSIIRFVKAGAEI